MRDIVHVQYHVTSHPIDPIPEDGSWLPLVSVVHSLRVQVREAFCDSVAGFRCRLDPGNWVLGCRL